VSRIFFYPDLQLLLRAARQVQVAASERCVGRAAVQHNIMAAPSASPSTPASERPLVALLYRIEGQENKRLKRAHVYGESISAEEINQLVRAVFTGASLRARGVTPHCLFASLHPTRKRLQAAERCMLRISVLAAFQ
jgi:hypothetical protein